MLLARARNLAILTFGTLLAVSLMVSTADAVVRVGYSPGAGTASDVAVAGGTLTGTNGAAMPGVAVDLYAWPPDAAVRAMKVGQLVPTALLAATATNSAGKFMLLVPSEKLRVAAVESGYANLEIVSAAGDIWFLSYPSGTLPARPPAPVTVNFSAKRRKHLCGTDSSGHVYPNTGWVKLRERKPAWAVVGQGYVARQKKTAGDYMQFEYNKTTDQNQTSTLGLGISGSGFDAGYNSSGASTSTATGSEDYPNEPTNTWFRTMFSVGQFRAVCYGFGKHVPHEKQSGKCPHTFTNSDGTVFRVRKCLWMVKSTGWFGGATVVRPKPIPNTPGKFCAEQQAGTTFKTSKEKAVQWSSGYEIGASTGIKGVKAKVSFSSSAQTGYDSNALMKFHFGRTGFACGTDKDPSRAPIVVVRGSRP